jgi:hypothetical protein
VQGNLQACGKRFVNPAGFPAWLAEIHEYNADCLRLDA